jgi:hypothetical protein
MRLRWYGWERERKDMADMTVSQEWRVWLEMYIYIDGIQDGRERGL